MLGDLLADRVKNLGLIVPQFGVMIMDLQPNQVLYEAMQEYSAAPLQGNASLYRILPLIHRLSQEQPNIAFETLLISLAAATSKNDGKPSILFPPYWENYFMNKQSDREGNDNHQNLPLAT
jgi:hypothetical protein